MNVKGARPANMSAGSNKTEATCVKNTQSVSAKNQLATSSTSKSSKDNSLKYKSSTRETSELKLVNKNNINTSQQVINKSKEMEQNQIQSDQINFDKKIENLESTFAELFNEVRILLPSIGNDLEKINNCESLTAADRLDRMKNLMAEKKETLTKLKTNTNKDNQSINIEQDKANNDENTENVNPYLTQTKSRKSKRKKFIPLDLTNLPNAENVQRFFYTLRFSYEDRREICPYKLLKELKDKIGNNIKIHSSNGNSFIIELPSQAEINKLNNIQILQNKPILTISKHKFFNNTKGLIFIYQYDLNNFNEFAQSMKEENPNIEEIVEATFIKSQKYPSKPLLITFNTTTLPFYLDIPGERSPTNVIPYKPKPMRCYNCLKYGHTTAKCNSNAKCRICTSEEHDQHNCNETPKCLYCNKEHSTGNQYCEREIKENKILQIQTEQKVGRRRAEEILNGEEIETYYTEASFTKFFTIQVTENLGNQSSTNIPLKSINPYQIKKHIQTHLGSKPGSLRCINNEYILEVMNKQQSEKIQSMTSLLGKECKVNPSKNYGTTKAIIYTQNYGCPDLTGLKENLTKEYNITDITAATWIKPKNPRTRAFLITFSGQNIPNYINILGEETKIKVNPYIPKPAKCNNCQEYGHVSKFCKNAPNCNKCSKQHKTESCTSEINKCYHCQENHQAGANICKVYKIEQEIVQLQTKNNIPRYQAKLLYERLNPSHNMNYANSVNRKPTQPRQNNISQNLQSMETETIIDKRRRSPDDKNGNEHKNKRNRNSLTPNLTQTPDHLTSENCPEIREQVHQIFNSEHIPEQTVPNISSYLDKQLKEIIEENKPKQSHENVYFKKPSTSEKSYRSKDNSKTSNEPKHRSQSKDCSTYRSHSRSRSRSRRRPSKEDRNRTSSRSSKNRSCNRSSSSTSSCSSSGSRGRQSRKSRKHKAVHKK